MASLSRAGQEPSRLEIPKGTTGAVGELIASADLLRRGYHVFRALSPNCPCDLLAYRPSDGPRMTLRVQVRTARVVRVGPSAKRVGVLNFSLKERDEGTFDVLALVVDEAKSTDVYYVPMLPDSTPCPYGISSWQLSWLRKWGTLRGVGWQGVKSNLEQPLPQWPPMPSKNRP